MYPSDQRTSVCRILLSHGKFKVSNFGAEFEKYAYEKKDILPKNTNLWFKIYINRFPEGCMGYFCIPMVRMNTFISYFTKNILTYYSEFPKLFKNNLELFLIRNTLKSGSKKFKKS